MKFIVRKLLPASAAFIIALSFTMVPALTTIQPVYAAACPVSPSTDTVFHAGQMNKFDTDNPVRPTPTNPDKNFKYREAPSTVFSNPSAWTGLVTYTVSDTKPAPQVATIFNPARIPGFTNNYLVHNWDWIDSNLPGSPGTRGSLRPYPQSRAIGMTTTPGEPLRSPCHGYNVGSPWGTGGMGILYADSNSITLTATRYDSVAKGYSLHILGINTDPALVSLYNSKDNPGGARYHNASFDLPGLKPGQIFGTAAGTEIIVAFRDNGDFMDTGDQSNWWRVTSWPATPYTPPGPGLTAPANGAAMQDRSPDFSWTGMAGTGNTYKVELDNDSGFGSMITTPAASTALTYTASPDLADDTYFWRVRAFNSSAVQIGLSGVRSFTVDNVAPPAPNASNLGVVNSSPTLSWSNPGGGATAYKGEVDDDSGFGSPSLINEQSGTSFNSGSLGLTPQHYYWRLKARDAAGNWSPAFGSMGEFGLAPAAPGLSSPASGAALTTGSVPFSWNGVTGGASYEIKVDNNSDGNSPEYTAPSASTSHTSSSLPLDGTNYWGVRAVNVDGEAGPWSAMRKFTVNRKPPAPTLISPAIKSFTKDSTPDFVWNAAGSGENAATNYTVTVKLGTTVVQSVPFTSSVCVASVCTGTSPGLGDGVYTFNVMSSNSYTVGAGNVSASNKFTVDTVAPVVPLNTSPKPGANYNKPIVKLKVKSSKGATLYDFKLSRLPDMSSPTLGSYKKGTLAFDLGLNFGEYWFNVRATDAAGNQSVYGTPTSFIYTLMKAPKNGLPTKSGIVKFSWKAYALTANYDLAFSQNAAFDPNAPGAGDTVLSLGNLRSHSTKLAPLAPGTWYWTVRVNGSVWMPKWSFIVP